MRAEATCRHIATLYEAHHCCVDGHNSTSPLSRLLLPPTTCPTRMLSSKSPNSPGPVVYVVNGMTCEIAPYAGQITWLALSSAPSEATSFADHHPVPDATYPRPAQM